MEILPFTADYDQRFIAQLGDEKYVIDSRWNERGQTWSFDLTRDSDQELLLCGAPMQIGQDILDPYALGIGGLIVSDLGRKDTDAGPEDLGTRVIVAYLSPDELVAIKAIMGSAGASIITGGVIPPVPAGGGGGGGGSGGGGGTGGGTTIVNADVTNVVNNITINGGLNFDLKTADELSDSSGDEVLILRDIALASLEATLALSAAALASGAGTLRIYVGGIYEAIGFTGTPSGVLRDSATVGGVGENTYDLNATFANPGGMLAVKVTMQSDAPGTDIAVSILRGAMG